MCGDRHFLLTWAHSLPSRGFVHCRCQAMVSRPWTGGLPSWLIKKLTYALLSPLSSPCTTLVRLETCLAIEWLLKKVKYANFLLSSSLGQICLLTTHKAHCNVHRYDLAVAAPADCLFVLALSVLANVCFIKYDKWLAHSRNSHRDSLPVWRWRWWHQLITSTNICLQTLLLLTLS